jgi:hypothetical protein
MVIFLIEHVTLVLTIVPFVTILVVEMFALLSVPNVIHLYI